MSFFCSSAARWTLITIAIAISSDAAMWAQAPAKRPAVVSAQARREELEKNQEVLSDPDPNARLADMEKIVNSGDTTRIESALKIVFHSDDQSMRALGLRAYIASLKELTFEIQLPAQIQRQYDDAQGDADKTKELSTKFPYLEVLAKSGLLVRIVFSKYDMTKSTGVADSGSGRPGTFTISGDRLTGSMPTRFLYNPTCNFDFRPATDMSLKGTLTCEAIGVYIFPRFQISAPIF